MTGRVIPAAEVWQFMRAMARRARRMMKNGWRPACVAYRDGSEPPAKCGKPATHVCLGGPMCRRHASKEQHAEQI